MKIKNKILLFVGFVTLFINPQIAQSQNQTNKLWYNQPADEWMKSTPIGNGRLGAMIYGGIDSDKIAMNEVTMWSGAFDENQERACGKDTLAKIRQLFFDGKLAEGNRLGSKHLSGTSHSFGSHLPIGDLNIKFNYPAGKANDYRRELNIENAINSVSFKLGKVLYKREYFSSNPDDAIIVRLTASEKGALNLSLSLDLLRKSQIISSNNSIEFSGQATLRELDRDGVNFLGKVGVKIIDGKITAKNGSIDIRDATTVLIVIDVRTDYKSPQYKALCRKTLNSVLAKPYSKLKERHINDYSKLFSRVDLFLGESEADNLPTDIRWQRVKDGKEDAGLQTLFFQYARYLLVAASRVNSPLPANLQGIWNDNLACNMGWNCDYHLDINTQQNYWLSNVGNLSECNTPLFDYIKDLSGHGEKTAQKVYGCRGWTAHTVANVWGHTAPGGDVGWGLFPTASSWIASHLWTDYIFTQDKTFLEKKAYPILKSNALFLLDFLVENPHNGYLMTGPSTSPENSFLYKGENLSLSMMPTCDRVLSYEIFSSCIEASKILGKDKSFRDSLQNALEKLPPVKIGKNGGVQEWFDDFDLANPNHRHTTHLLGLYPFAQISSDKTPELAVAAKKTMSDRLNAAGWEDTEWSRANMICFYARLKDPVEAYKSVVELQRIFTRENLLTISPKGIAGAPYDIFIFDGNEAGAAGIAEMLLQSQDGYIEFLPALPVQWKTGHFKGLSVIGGANVDLKWKNGNVQNARIKATANNVFKIKVPQNQKQPEYYKNDILISLVPDSKGLIELKLIKNEILSLKYE